MNYGKMKKQLLRQVASQNKLKDAAKAMRGGSPGQDKVYRPDRDGPKRIGQVQAARPIAQKLPSRKPAGQRARIDRPDRRAIQTRPINIKPIKLGYKPKRRAM